MRYNLFSLLFVAWSSLSLAVGIIAPPSKALVSPDGERSVRLLAGDREGRYEITQIKTGKAINLPAICSPVFAMTWSHDARSIYVIAHIARGRVVQILHLTDNKWRSYYVEAPEKQDHEYKVVDWSIGAKALELVCVVLLNRGTHGPPIYEVTFDVDPATGKTSRVRNKKELTHQEWVSYKSRFEP